MKSVKKTDLKKIIFLVDEAERMRLAGLLGEQIKSRGTDLRFVEEEDKEALYIVSDEEKAGQLQRMDLAVVGYRDAAQHFDGIKWLMEPIDEEEPISLDELERMYRRCKKLPWDILETERLLVRETTVEDVDAFYRIYKEPSITRYTEDLFEDPEMERAYTENYRDTIYSLYGFGMWTVVEKASGLVIGRAGISMRDGYEEPELGFIIGVPWQRKGYAFEVCSAILRYAKEELGFDKAISFVMEENKASIALCEKLGFLKCGDAALGKEPYILFCKVL